MADGLKWTTVGVQHVSLYPWNGATGPYDSTTEETLQGIDNIDFGSNVSLAEGWGAESQFLLFSAETKRDMELRAGGFRISLRLYSMLLGGDYAVDAAGTQTEKQYWAGTNTGRAKYFRMKLISDNGDGTMITIIPKIKVNGNFAQNMRKDQVNMVDFSGKPHFDYTYVTQTGTTGAICDIYYSNSTDLSPVS